MYYFAYASNLNLKQMQARCPLAKPKFVATLPNHKLIFSGWSRKWRGGVASIKICKGEKVTGAVYEISQRDLMALDKYEDYPGTYGRVNVIVFTGLDDAIEAITYIKTEQSEETQPSQEYLATIRQGLKDWEIA